MTLEQLIQEGRKLQRPCVFLRPEGEGPPAAIWHEREENEDEIDSTGHRRWLTIDTRHVPNLLPTASGCMSILTDEETFQSGRVEAAPDLDSMHGTALYAHLASVLPPLEALFARPSDAVQEWILSHGWEPGWGYENNFKGSNLADDYQRLWQQEHPMYSDSDIYAVLGGWHFPMPDGDWKDLIDEHLLVFTLRDSEPWVEAWRTRAGDYKVIQRTT